MENDSPYVIFNIIDNISSMNWFVRHDVSYANYHVRGPTHTPDIQGLRCVSAVRAENTNKK